MDAPFNIHLYPDNWLSLLGEPSSTQGYCHRVKLIDSTTGTLVHQRLIDLEHDLSMRLYNAIIHQSVMDNFEWQKGYTMTFGLVAVDRKNGQKRTPKPSLAYLATGGDRREK